MRRFDGVEDEPAGRRAPARSSWTRKPQFGLLVTASLVAVIGLPAALIALRNSDLNPPREVAAPSPRTVPIREPKVALAPQPEAAVAVTRLTEEPSTAPPVHHRDVVISENAAKRQVTTTDNQPLDAADPRAVAAAAPPPPRAPPSPAPALAQKSANDAVADSVVVTGSMLPAPALEKSRAARSEGYVGNAVGGMSKDRSYAAFLTDLKAAVRANDRDAVIGLIAFPLRVNSNGKSRLYRSASEVRRDYDRIFTPRVTRAIRNQRVDQLFVRDLGAMIGDGQIWFDHVCANSACSPPGPVRIKAVNP